MSLHYYHAGEAYDVTPELAEYLVAEGFASIEMRSVSARRARAAMIGAAAGRSGPDRDRGGRM